MKLVNTNDSRVMVRWPDIFLPQCSFSGTERIWNIYSAEQTWWYGANILILSGHTTTSNHGGIQYKRVSRPTKSRNSNDNDLPDLLIILYIVGARNNASVWNWPCPWRHPRWRWLNMLQKRWTLYVQSFWKIDFKFIYFATVQRRLWSSIQMEIHDQFIYSDTVRLTVWYSFYKCHMF